MARPAGVNAGADHVRRSGVAGGDMRRARLARRWRGLILTAAVMSGAALLVQAGPGRRADPTQAQLRP